MTQEDKKLLLKDLSARLPYGVFCSMGLDYPLPLQRLFINKLDGTLLDFYEDGKDYQVYLSEVKPYLRPMSSMTEEEMVYIDHRFGADLNGDIDPTPSSIVELSDMVNFLTWLNKNHFDYRGLIEKGLAIDCTDLRRVITENEILMLIDWYLDNELEENQTSLSFESHTREGKRLQLKFVDENKEK